VPGQYDQATDGTQAQQLYEQVLAMVQGSHVNMREGDGTLTCDDLCLLASRLPVLMQLLRRRGSVLPAASAIAQHAVDSLQQGDLPTTPRFWSELLYGLTKVGLVINAEMNASQIAKQHQQTNIHLHQLLDEGVMYLPSLLASKGAAAQDISMTLLAYAYAGYTGNLGPVVQAVADNLDRCLQRPAPQGIANTVWALGKLCDMGVPTHREPGVKASAYSWPVFSYALQQLTSFLHSGGMKPKPQEISNAVYGCALAGHTEGLPQFLALVCQHPGGVLDRAVPQDWSNMAWGTAVLFEAAANGGNMQLAGDLQRYGILLLARCLQRPDIVRGSKPQELSNTVWAAAKLRRVQEGSQLLNNLASNIHIMAEAKQQEWANSVWAAATLYEAAVDAGYQQLAQQLRRSGHVLMAECVKRLSVLKGAAPQAWSNIMCAAAKLGCEQEGAQLFCQLTNNLAVMKGAVSQAWSNILWAAAVLRLYNQDLFKRAMRELSAIPSAAIKPQEPSNALWACAICAHWDSGVQQLLSRVGESDLARFNRQDLANTAWAWAVLVCLAQEDGSYEQHEQCFQQVAVGLFRGAALHPVNSCTLEEGQQLYQARLLAGYLGIPGLPAGQVLQDALQAGLTADATSSRSQKGVNSVLREMGYSTQLEGLSRDSLMRADIVITALPGGRPCSIAVEYDGAPHYIAEHSVRTTAIDRLEGPIRLRNALLSRSFADGVFCIYWRDWAAVEGDREASVEYLSKALAKVVRDKVGALVRRRRSFLQVRCWLQVMFAPCCLQPSM
jgi:hypothetical protein